MLPRDFLRFLQRPVQLAVLLLAASLIFAAPRVHADDCPPDGDPPGSCLHWDESSCSWVSDEPYGGCQNGYWDSNSCSCIPDCSYPSYPQPGPCYYWDSTTCEWISMRPPGDCPSGTAWNDSTCTCEPTCEPPPPQPPGCYTFDSVACAWNHVDTTCPYRFHWDEDTCSCIDDCATPTSPAPGPCYDWSVPDCSWISRAPAGGCPTGQVWDDTACACVCPQPDPPQPGPCYHYDSSICAWVHNDTTCESGYIYDENYCYCVRDCSIPYPADPPDPCAQWSEGQCAWVTPDKYCQDHYRWDDSSCTCVPDCSSPTYPQPGNCYTWDSDSCEWLSTYPADGCPSGQTWNDQSCTCECVQPSQPDPCYTWNQEQCQWVPPNTNCDYGYYWDPVACTCVRDCSIALPQQAPGTCYTWDIGTCAWVAPMTTCERGYMWSEGLCMCVRDCSVAIPENPPGNCYWWNSSDCEWKNKMPEGGCVGNWGLKVWNEMTCECECPPDGYWDCGPNKRYTQEACGCICDAQEPSQGCGVGYRWSEADCKCVCTDETFIPDDFCCNNVWGEKREEKNSVDLDIGEPGKKLLGLLGISSPNGSCSAKYEIKTENQCCNNEIKRVTGFNIVSAGCSLAKDQQFFLGPVPVVVGFEVEVQVSAAEVQPSCNDAPICFGGEATVAATAGVGIAEGVIEAHAGIKVEGSVSGQFCYSTTAGWTSEWHGQACAIIYTKVKFWNLTITPYEKKLGCLGK